jgi:hypothetical protein
VKTRCYTVSCTVGPLTDREVDALADYLWDQGAGQITFRPLVHGSRADSTADRDALRDALQHETQRGLKW